MPTVRTSAPGKIILFGEHAVVHSQPALAVPLTAVQVMVTAEKAADGAGITILAPDINQRLHLPADAPHTTGPVYNALARPVLLALEHLDYPIPDLVLTVRSTIPIAGGLGSGAALATALIRATAAALESPLDNVALNNLVYAIEKLHHGTPSGIDNTVIVYEQPVYFVRGRPIETFPIARPFDLVLADTGVSSPTHLSVGDVRRLYDAEPDRIGTIFAQIGALVKQARQCIESGDVEALGPLMDQNHTLLDALTVSSPELDQLCCAAREAGALGAKLSGGGRGGNMIALVTPDRAAPVAAALTQAGAHHVIQTTVG